MHIPGLRSDRETVGGLVFFGRMLDKIRLHAEGRLPPDYNRGHGFDGRMCRFLHVDYEAVARKTLEECDDLKVLNWCFEVGRRPSAEEIFVFNTFLSKRGWQDDTSDWVREQKEKMGLSARADIQTAFDIHDADERRK
jgi:gluconokinase